MEWNSRSPEKARSGSDTEKNGQGSCVLPRPAPSMNSNPLWGAPRVHGELAKLGISIPQAAVSKYMIRHRKPPCQTSRSFLDNHVKDSVSVDFFTLPTATFRVLFVFIVLRHDRRDIIHFNATEHPTAEWTTQQMVDAFPWDSAPRYMLRDRDGIYGRYFQPACRRTWYPAGSHGTALEESETGCDGSGSSRNGRSHLKKARGPTSFCTGCWKRCPMRRRSPT